METRLRPLVIVDDNEDDRFILKTVLQKAGLLHPVRDFAAAEDAIAFLSNLATSEGGDGATLPLACFIDVRMNGFNGFELVEWVRNHDVFRRMPLIVTSSSEHPEDLQSAARAGAQCYALKYPAAAAMRDLIGQCERFALNPAADTFPLPFNLFRGRPSLPRIGPQ